MDLRARLERDDSLLIRLAVIAVAPMLVSPLLQFVHNIFFPEKEIPYFGYKITYPDTIQFVNSYAAAFVIVLWLLFVLRAVVTRKVPRDLVSAYLPQFMFIGLVLWAVSVSYLCGNTEYMTEGFPILYEPMTSFALYFVGYFFCGMLMTKDYARKKALLLIIATGAILGTLVLVDLFVISLTPPFFPNEVCAVFYNSNHYGYFLTMCILLSAVLVVVGKTKWIRIISAYSFLCNSIVLNINNTLGSFLAVLLGLVVMAFLAWRGVWENDKEPKGKILKTSLVVLGAYIAVMFAVSMFYNTILRSLLVMVLDLGKILGNAEDADRAGSSRWKIWKETIRYIGERPFCGHGVDGIAMRLLDATGFSRSHNEYLQYTAFWGMPSLLLYLCACIFSLVRSWKNRFGQSPYVLAAWIASLGYMASAFFGNTKYYVAPFFFVLLGVVASSSVSESSRAVENNA